ncbi:UDP-glycosyltransferase 71A15 [Linum perenne]
MSRDGLAMFRRVARDFRKTKGILVNTVKEVESHATDTLSRGLTIPIPKVYPVGPILNLNNDVTHDVIDWLDRQPDMGAFGREQVREIAHALERSGERFLWSLRRPTGEGLTLLGNPKEYDDFGEVLPEGFLDRTAEVGRVIGWAPQTAVLAHKATLWFGVPVATWPMYAEQQLNAFLLVKELGIAAEISIDYQVRSEGGMIMADDIERGIRNLMMDKDCPWKKKMKEFSDKTREAIRDGGSSSSSIAEFLATL